MDTTLQRQREDRMASRKQFLVGFLIVLTIFLMLFFMTSDYNFSVSFRANSHPLHLKEEETRRHPKYFGKEEVEVAVYKGKEGEVVPEGLAPQGAGGPDKVVVINADEEKIMEEIAEEMKEEGGWMVGEEDREFPKIEINHDVEAKPVQPTDDVYTDALTTDKSTTTNETTEKTTTTTTPPPTSTTTEASSVSTTDDIWKRNKKVEVRRKKRDNMAHLTTNIPSSAPSSTPSTTTPTTSPREDQTELIQGVSVESSDPANIVSSAHTTLSLPAVVETSTKTVSKSGVVVTDLSTTAVETVSKSDGVVADFTTTAVETVSKSDGVVADFTTTATEDKQSSTETPEFITSASDFTTPNFSDSKNTTEQKVTDSESHRNSNSQLNGHNDNEVVFIENNELPEEFLSDDENNSDNSFV